MKTFIGYTKLIFLSVLLNLSLITSSSAQSPLLYGMTSSGGIYDTSNDMNAAGTIFRFDPANDSESVVWSLANGSDGQGPRGDLIYDPCNGMFYGMAPFGGSSLYYGAIIRFDPFNNSEDVVWNFGHGKDGRGPYGSLIFDPDNGLLYGMTAAGGSNGVGAIIRFDPGTNAESVVWNFGDKNDGQFPLGSLTYDTSNGLFYGMTYYGGIYPLGWTSSPQTSPGFGTLFSFDPFNNHEQVVWNFGNGTDGEFPQADVIYDTTNRLLYGVLNSGGSTGYGAIISFDPVSNAKNVVWNFGNGEDGKEPAGNLVYNANNRAYYGMTWGGGSNDNQYGGAGGGTIYSFDPTTNTEAVVWNFGGGTDGYSPWGSLTYDTFNGKYYGMTYYGGNVVSSKDFNSYGGGPGTIISFDPSNNSEKVLWTFGSGSDGFDPYGDLVLYTPGATTCIPPVNILSFTINVYPNPTAGEFTLEGLTTGQTVQVYNYLVQLVAGGAVKSATQQFDISAQPKGVYLVQISGSDGVPVGEGKVLKIN